MYASVLTLAVDDTAFDRMVSDMEEHTKFKRGAQVYSAGKDVFTVLAQALKPLGQRDAQATRRARLRDAVTTKSVAPGVGV